MDLRKHCRSVVIAIAGVVLVLALVAAAVAPAPERAETLPTPTTVVNLPDSVPVTTEVDQTGYQKGIYISYGAIGNADFQTHVKELLETTELNAAVMDFKGDRGYLSFPTEVQLAQEIGAGAAPAVSDAAEFLKWYKDHDVYLIARIVTFKDNLLTKAYPGWAVIDSATGGVWKDREGLGWIDPNLHAGWDYNIALAQEAARLGFDEVQFDYVRFPTDGAVSRTTFSLPNTQEQRTAAVSGFLKRASEAIRPLGVKVGADVFGLAPWSSGDLGIGQHIESIAPYLDVLSPMAYPSTYADGLPGESPEYRNAIAYPYEIVNKTTQRAVSRASAVNPNLVVRSWLQDFQDYAFDERTYTAAEIRAQMDGARDAGGRGWLLWDPAVKYTPQALMSAVPSYAPNAQGGVPVLAYGTAVAPEGEQPRAPENLRADLERLLSAGYYPVTLYDFVQRHLSMVPAGKRPVVLTFDGATEDQFRLLADGSVDPSSAVGILTDFSDAHPWEWPLHATFFVPPGDTGHSAFGPADQSARKLELLATWGLELAGQTADGVDLSRLSPDEVQHELARPHAYIASLVPGYDIYSLNVPAGKLPTDPALLIQGASGGSSYTYGAVTNATVGLAPSFLSPDFVSHDLPRVPATQPALDAALRDAYKVGVGYVSPGE
jgi:hypothetical protein